jgi:two-component system, NarL family, nitrate/nitrite response regulator NarL
VPYPGRIRVYVAFDQPMLMQALADAIRERPDLELAGAAPTGSQALEDIRALAPDVAVLDMRLPALDGRQVLEHATSEGMRTRFLYLSADMGGGIVYGALAAGASGYLSQTLDRDAVCDAIAAVAEGKVVLSPEAQAKLAGAIREREGHERPALTARERAVLSLCAEGLSTRDIALRLGVASATVKTHLQSIYHKLDAPDRTSAVAAALRRGLLE